MDFNKNSSNYNGKHQNFDESESYSSSSSEIIATKELKPQKETNISQEKKQQNKEKNKLAMQKRRANLSEE